MTNKEFCDLEPNKSKVRIKSTGAIHVVKAFLYISTPAPAGYVALLDNDEHYSPEYLDLVD